MPSQTIILSSAGTSPSANLDWRGGQPASVQVSAATAGSSGVFVLQYTLDDPQLSGGSSAALWQGVSSAIGSSATTFTLSTAVNGVLFQFPTPVAAVRLNATSAISLTMKTMQGE